MAARIRDFDWSNTPLGSSADWPQALRAAVDLILDASFPSYVWWGPDLVQFYNDPAIDVNGSKHPGLLGTSARTAWPDLWGIVGGIAERVFTTGRPERGEDVPMVPDRGGPKQTAWFTFSYSALRNETGTVAGLFITGIETTELVRAQMALRDSEERHRLVIESWAQAVWETDANGMVVADSPSWRAYTGQSLQEWLGYGWLDAIHPDDRAYAEQQWREAIAARAPVNADFRLRVPGNGWRWTNVRAAPRFGSEGHIEKWVGINIDIDSHKRAENELRISEERFREFGRASSDGLWIRDAKTLKLQYASDAMEVIYGLSNEAMTADPMAWPALIVPEDRDETFGYIERVKAGESVVHEFRIQRPSDLQFRWIRSVGFPLFDERGDVSRLAGISSDITEQKQLTEHQGILLAELQHRVRNIMGLIRSIGNRSAVGASSVEDYRQALEGRMLALARVQALLTREANAGGSLRDIIEGEVQVQAYHPHQFNLIGPDIILSPKAVEVLTLAFHELATNALKYGAFSVPEGRLTVHWSQFEKRGSPWLVIDWVEEGRPPQPPPTRRGFGSELIEARIPYELGGMGKVSIESGGARCRIEFPLQDAESILETDAPMPLTTFGGTIDMTGAPNLTGRIILVVEDDYYLAADTVAALRGAGATVLGPCPSQETTHDLLKTELPTHAILDLNLGGGGPKFDIAQLLKARNVPFIFITGYDPDVIPPELADVPRLQKPTPFRTIVEAISQL
ncbi:PAS domain S-box protein (plasmid) [Paracoccus liaowanqingii]|uniref:histidine kinase n=2 Tax=Paracoccus liaowanqingii TaxID=2560053 RepID=A0A4Y5SSB1_9RHOB|nr:PAS domain S-box protein [Paracoccus liaowanqingii]